MAQYYLKHFFDPDFDHLATDKRQGDNESDLYSMGYVQNAIKGQILAQVVPLQDVPGGVDVRFIRDAPDFPAGPNTYVDPAHPDYLLASSNGYVFYNNGRITIKHLLNVRQDVSFQTGNIFFVGDMCVHGSVRAGFSVQASDVRIKGLLEGGIARARKDLLVEGGARGGAGKHCVMDAGGKIHVPFVEKMQVRGRGNIIVEKYCLYSSVYGGANMMVGEQLYGCTVNVYGSVYVGKQLGNKAALATKVFLGYNPLNIRNVEKIEALIASISTSITHLKNVAGHLPPDTNDMTRKLANLTEEREQLKKRRDVIWQGLHLDEQNTQNCNLLVPGIVYPGVEICIGRAYMNIERPYENSLFRLCYDDIIVQPIPPGLKHPGSGR
ncbi:MAG: FapA family protein [Desulfovibrio sp.]|jgi:uncharacterized protein (DUF342 family)|nr:FapA family protein [Desulfovibrio sp.]